MNNIPHRFSLPTPLADVLGYTCTFIPFSSPFYYPSWFTFSIGYRVFTLLPVLQNKTFFLYDTFAASDALVSPFLSFALSVLPHACLFTLGFMATPAVSYCVYRLCSASGVDVQSSCPSPLVLGYLPRRNWETLTVFPETGSLENEWTKARDDRVCRLIRV